MVKKLRKRHLQVWAILAVLIPAGIISGWLVVPRQVTGNLLQPAAGTALPVIIKSNKKDSYIASIRTNLGRSQFQLELIQKKASKSPSCLVYQCGNKENELIGRVAGQGSYYFALTPESLKAYNFILYDIIHKRITDSISFNPNFQE